MMDLHTYTPILQNQSGRNASRADPRKNGIRINKLNALFFSLGALINVFSYLSLSPVVVSAMFFLLTHALLKLTRLGGAAEIRMFNRVYCVGFLMAGVAAVYANQLNDAGQLFSDAGGFFNMAAHDAADLTLLEIQIIHEGALGIVLWRAIYDFFDALGFEKIRYIGIATNTTMVALSGVIGIKIIRIIFGNDEYRFRRLTLLVSSCGLFWLFASIHIRDSIILFFITALAYTWLHFLARPDLGYRLLQIILWSLLTSAFFGFLRGEFIFVPAAMAMAAIASMFFGQVERQRRRIAFILIIIGCFVAVVLAFNFFTEIMSIMYRGKTGYSEIANEQYGTESLGLSLIVNQPTRVRLILGSIYLFVYPIPFWIGFQFESAYSFFKSTNVIFFYFFLPLIFITLSQLKCQKWMRTPGIMFMFFLALGFILAIAATSLETRHFGTFLLPIFVLAIVPDLRVKKYWSIYKNYLFILLSGVLIVHLTWIFLKI